jgi:hypothetical protein
LQVDVRKRSHLHDFFWRLIYSQFNLDISAKLFMMKREDIPFVDARVMLVQNLAI